MISNDPGHGGNKEWGCNNMNSNKNSRIDIVF